MRTKLGKACIGIVRKNTGYASFISFSTGSIGPKCSKKVKNYQGVEKYISMVPYNTDFTPRVQAVTANPGIYFGSGTTPASEDDYTIEDVITSGITVTVSPNDGSGAYYYDADSNSESAYLTYTITNTGSSAITISEICTFSNFSTGSDYGASASSTFLFLVDRTVLDVPLVIEAGASGVLRYEIIFNGDEIV